jgi:hypothetical protein
MSDNAIAPEFVGALLECFIEFPLFNDDYDCLVKAGYIEPVSPEQCKWLKSKTSLAEYFRWVGKGHGRITGGFWNPISRAFGMNKMQLQKLAGRNGNVWKKPESRHFEDLKDLVIPCRLKLRRIYWETAAFNEINKLMNETKSKEPETTPETIHDVLQKIENIIVVRKLQFQNNFL